MIAPTDFLYSNPVKLLPECPVPVFQTKTKRLRVYGSAEFTAVGCKATGFINFSHVPVEVGQEIRYLH